MVSYDEESFLSGIAVGRNLMGWPAMDGTAADAFVFLVESTAEQLEYAFRADMVGTVSWGDGNTESISTSGSMTDVAHEYDDPGIYMVTVRGTFQDFTLANAAEYRKRVRAILTAFPRCETYHYLGYANLQGLFSGLENLVSIPANLLSDLKSPDVQISSLNSMFYGCKSLRAIPRELFHGLLFVASTMANPQYGIGQIFSGCAALEVLPDDLFSNPGFAPVTRADGLFSSCSALREVPENLFSVMSEIQQFSATFSGCSSLREVPENLFLYNTAVTGFTSVFARSGLASIPARLFASLLGTVTNYGYTFSDCTGLSGIPSSLFDGALSNASFYYTFSGDSGVIGAVPDLWNYHTITSRNYCYSGCTRASNYADIPMLWK